MLSKIAESPPHFEMLLDMETSSTLCHTILSLLKKSHVVADCKSDAALEGSTRSREQLLGRGDSERPSIQSIPSTLVAGCLQILTRLVRPRYTLENSSLQTARHIACSSFIGSIFTPHVSVDSLPPAPSQY